MQLSTYPLVPSAAFTAKHLPLTRINHAAAWALPNWDVEVTLADHPEGWLVTGPTGYLGLVANQDKERYFDVDRVFRSGLLPQCQARLTSMDATSGQLTGALLLPPAMFAVPVGTVPDGAEVLRQGQPLDMDLAVELLQPCQVLVELGVVGQRVVAVYDGQLIGGLARPPAALHEAVSSRKLVARAFVAHRDAILDIDPEVRSAPITNLSAEGPAVLPQAEQTPAKDVEQLPTVMIPAVKAGLE
ncbi:hypothetical protein [Corynebacterium uterequi]|uniref:Uncharacterized protein n=1 Tax=Corynebacterium uterequi TaxID=1072256 RepID=A0A0G3HBN5_9CORY|nr:hypothetical protein [Corynebacterium uterequi]AKK10806.1 hypothetical protein CUTER_04000 [Corynebacterium uterequi]